MIGLGTLIDTGAIIIGGLIGLFIKKGIPKRIHDGMIKAIGLSIIFMGISGVVEKVTSINNYPLVMIISMLIGTLIGELVNFNQLFINFGEMLKTKTSSKKDKEFLNGFLTASFAVAIGAMAVIGSIKDGMQGDYTILLAKSILDFVITLILSSTLGKGCIYAFIPVFVFQGLMTVGAHLIGPILTLSAINNLALIGSMLITVVGINLMFDQKIKVANMLPAILIAVICAYFLK
jgi:uncharacterized protein